MVPPPDNTGDEFPDFEKMTLEQQMAWLESLARRQGAKEEEFTTAADLEIPVPENPVIDEPGYVPYSISGDQSGSKKPAEPKPEIPAAPPPSPEPPAPPVFEIPSPPPLEFDRVGQAEEAEMDEAADPMHWLSSLAARPGEELDSLAFDFEAGIPESLGEEAETDTREFEPEAELSPAEFEVAPLETQDWSSPISMDDVLAGNVDPQLWLESLAARQGARPDELVTSADLSIADVPEDAVIDEPGYVPYDISSGSAKAEQPREPAPESLEPLGGADPMTWLESLAKRQGASAEEFTTAADLQVPEVPEGTTVDEPGYSDYSPFAQEEAEFEFAGRDQFAEEQPMDFGEADASLSWLEELAAVPDAGMADFLSLEQEIAEEPLSVETPAEAAEDMLAGLTDEEIAYRQAQGQLTGAQELAWLQRQAAKLAEARRSEPEEVVEVEPAELAPAELPDWLLQIRDETEPEVVAEEPEEPALVAEEDLIPAVSEMADLPDWLAEAAPQEETELPELTFDTGVESLWAEPVEEVAPVLEEEGIESELVAFLKGDLVPDEADQLAEALDDEYDRRVAGDESEPEWYTEAVAHGAGEPVTPAEAPAEPAAQAFSEVAEAVPVEMPDWLKETEAPAPAIEGAMPDWLTEPVAAAEEVILPDWLHEEIEPAAAGWLAEEEAAPAPPVAAAAPVQPEAPPPVPVQAPIPRGELFEKYRSRLEEDPTDYANRLALARALQASQELPASLDQYDVLIDATQLLEDVQRDLEELVSEQPKDPRARRQLGDTYMRRGMLQEALEAYRSALDQL